MSVVTSAILASASAGLGVVFSLMGAGTVASAAMTGAPVDPFATVMPFAGGFSAFGLMIFFMMDYKKRAEKLTDDLAELNKARAEELKQENLKSQEVMRAMIAALDKFADGLHESSAATRESASAARENSVINKQLIAKLEH